MKRKLAAIFMTLVLLLGLSSQAFAAETPEQTQPAQASPTQETEPEETQTEETQTEETQTEETQTEETQAIEIKETISIYTPEDLVALGESCSLDTWSLDKQVVLEADISLSEVDFEPIATFGGIFEGNGHVISDWNLTGDFAPAGLFGIVQSTGRVRDLTLEGTVEPGGEGSNVGGIAGENYGRLENCTFSGTVTGKRSTGGIAGSNYGTITGCSAEGALTGTDRTGGIAGYNDGKIVSCRNAMSINTESVDPTIDITKVDLNFNLDLGKKADIDVSDAASDTGGIAGYSCGIIAASSNTGTIGYPHIGYNLGGIAGRNCGFIENCENSGSLMGRKDVGGVVGQIEPHVQTLLSQDYLDTLSKQFENLGNLVSRAGSNGAASGGDIRSSIQALTGYQSSARSAVNDLVESAKNLEFNESALASLGDSIHGMVNAGGSLERSVGDGLETLTDDVSAISGQIQSISKTFALATEDAKKETVTDISDVDLDAISDGRVAGCTNTGTVEADLNVGGITGTMGLESSVDPEDDRPSGSLTQRRRYELKAIVDSCENVGNVTAKRSYAGGICGRMELGLITESRGYGRISSEDGDYVGGIAGLAGGTVRDSFAKCTLSGNNYVGGVVGSGIQEDLSGDSSTVTGCYSMVEVTQYKQFVGAISGGNAGVFTNNYFVSDTLAGINRVSYASVAEPVTYEKMQRLQTLPQSLRELTLRFVADEKTVKTVSFHYGDSFDDSVFPDIPQKEGYYAKWDTRELTDLRFDTVVTADYLPYITSLNAQELRYDSRPVFFVQGQFQERDAIEVEHGASQTFRKEGLIMQEQWTLSIPADGQESHTIRFLPGQEDTHLYVLKNGSWVKVHPETMGTYLCFDAVGSQVELTAAVPMASGRSQLLMIAAGLVVLAVLALCTIRIKRSWKKSAPEAATTAKKPRKRGTKRKIIAAVLIAVAMVLAIIAFFCIQEPVEELSRKAQVYDVLKTYVDQEQRHMRLTVQAQVENKDADFTAEIATTKVGSKEVSVIRENDRCLYYCDGVVYLESGAAFQLNAAAPDYSQLAPRLLSLCQSAQVEPVDGVYTITVDGEQAMELAKLLLPSVQNWLPQTGRLTVDVITQNDALTQIRFTGAGNLADSVKTPFSVTATVDVLSVEDVTIPSPVNTQLLFGTTKPTEVYSDQLIQLLQAWANLGTTNPLGAQVTMSADLGSFSVEESFRYYAWKTETTTVNAVEKDDSTVYFTDKALCNADGRTVTGGVGIETDAAALSNVLYDTFQEAQFQSRSEEGATVYTVSLSSAAMEKLVPTILPKAQDLAIDYHNGSLQLRVEDGKIQSARIACDGSAKLAVLTANVGLTLDIEMDNESPIPELPEAVKTALAK